MPAGFTKHRPRYRATPAVRKSSAERGYGPDWRAEREAVKRSGACGPYVCSEPGCGRTDRLNLDHKVPRSQGGGEEPGNKWWKCPSHHSNKTAARDGGFGNPVKLSS